MDTKFSDFEDTDLGHVLEGLEDMQHYNDWIVSRFKKFLAGRAVEIGVGYGTMAERLRAHVSSLDLVEPTPALAQHLRDTFTEADGYSVLEESMGSWLAAWNGDAYDTAVMINVLEHIEDDVAAAKGIFGALKPGGHFLVFVPALPFLFSELDRQYGHYRRYTKHGLVDCLKNGGFEIVDVHFFDVAGVLPWWLLNTLMGKTAFNPGLLKIYDRFVVPVGRGFENMIRPPIGKNLIVIARRPQDA